MRSPLALLGIIGATSIAHAQSRADQVPPSRPDVQLPIAPAPSDETRDQPAQSLPNPQLVAAPPEPASKFILVGPTDDTISHHVSFSLNASYTNMFGSLDSKTPISNKLSHGYSLGLTAGYGLSRYVELELDAAGSMFRSAVDCMNCSARAYGLNGGIRYNLVQGVRFNPWVRVAVGISTFRLDDTIEKRNYLGLQWLNATIGGDWYATRNFGFGPMLSMALTSYFDHPSNSRTSVAAQWLAGLNVALDTAGK